MMEAEEWLSVSVLLLSLLTRPGELRTANGLFPAPVKIFGLENIDPPVNRTSYELWIVENRDAQLNTKNRFGIVNA